MRRMLFILVVVFVGRGAVLWAQTPALPIASVTTAAAAEPESNAVRLLVGRSTLINVGNPIARVSLTSADIADALVPSPSQLLINGKMPGTISMFVWDAGGSIRRYELIVQRDLSSLSEQLRQLLPGEAIVAQSNGKNVVLSGPVSSKDMAERAVSLAAGYVDKKDEVVSLLAVQTGTISNQVLLQVRFAEVSRSAMTELGASFFTSPLGVKNTLARVQTDQVAGPGFTDLQWTKADSKFGGDVTSASGKFTFSDFLNLFLFSEKWDLGLMVRALQTKGLFQSLAEPNLVAESGKEASFLAGGEFPVPIAQGSGGNTAISVVFKEFGVRLSFTPTVIGNRVNLKVKPEVSTLDFANAVTLNGFRIPALTTRRTETEVELMDGQTFAIAGLLNNTMTSTLQKIPGIGDIPILGQLFKSKAAQKNQTELVVMITPHVLTRDSHGVTPNLPRQVEPYLPPLPPKKSFDPPAPAFPPRSDDAAARTPAPQVAPIAGTQSPAEAARAVSALTPGGPKRMNTPATTPAAVPATTTAAPAPTSAPAAAPAATTAPAGDGTRPLSEDEQKILERARSREREAAKKDNSSPAEDAKRMRKQIADEAYKASKDKDRQDKLNREQAKRDAEAAKRAGEAARKQAEIDRKHQQAIDEAQAKLKAAEAAYQARNGKRDK